MTKKKRILLLSDDLRMHSGVACVSRDLVMGTMHKYEWVQIGGAIDHPEANGIVDMNEACKNELGLEKAYLKIYPTNGYGNPDMLRQIMEVEKPDAVVHYTDPRFWLWLYEMGHEIRTKVPLFYINIWDDLPDPMWNELFYRSCDLLMAISKQTYGINKRMLPDYKDWQITYVPHGIDQERFFQVNPNSSEFKEFKKERGLDKYKFVVLYVNRNIRRKMPGDVALAYKFFVDSLPEAERKDCVMVWHTNPIDDNGTDLPAVCSSLLPDYNVIFTYDKGGPYNDRDMNFLYNASDIYINLASNEGFGLGSAQSLMVGKPIVVNVTGGLQDQCGFKKEDGSYLTPNDYIELGSNHRGVYKEHGEWVKPVWPAAINLLGSPPTPYIYDDRCNAEDAAVALKAWYDVGPDGREQCGQLGREFVTDRLIGMDKQEMCKRFTNSFEDVFKNWKPLPKYTLEVV
jgi:glycosyltransferase involved in cell wall biosynthesis